MTERTNTRELILSILLSVSRDGEYSHMAIRSVLDKYRYLDRKDRAFIQMTAEGTIERRLTLDYIISQYSTVKTGKMKPVIREILRMSVFQMKFMDQIPASAVCNEAVKLAKKKGFHNLTGFVNGVLRNIARDETPVEYPDDSVRYSMPDWLCSAFTKWYGEEKAGKMMKASLEKQPLTVRCSRSRNTPEELAGCLAEEGVLDRQSSLCSDVFYLKNAPVPELASFREGRFAVQDLSSVLAGIAAAPEKGAEIIDVCAAPGGKSLHLADLLEGTGCVQARDISDYKMRLIQENVERMGHKNVVVRQKDALTLYQEDVKSADLVVADLPCSGLGVLARKSDLKYRITQEDLTSLASLQWEILQIVSQYVKPGGFLLYSTCTVNPSENMENVYLIEKNLPFERVSVVENMPEGLKGAVPETGCVQLLQGVDPCDGFFIAKFRRRSEEA